MKVYIVKGGDTLSEIAERELGDHRIWPTLYQINSSIIRRDPRNRAARKRFGGEPADWIFPNQVLLLPFAG